MKKNKKSTDSILKDIFDPISASPAKDSPKARHPHSSFPESAKPFSAPEFLESAGLATPSRLEKVFQEEPKVSKTPLTPAHEPFAEKIEEIKEESLLFQKELRVPEEAEVQARAAAEPVNAFRQEDAKADDVQLTAEPNKVSVDDGFLPAEKTKAASAGAWMRWAATGAVLSAVFVAGWGLLLEPSVVREKARWADREKAWASFDRKMSNEKEFLVRLQEMTAGAARQRQTVAATLRFAESSTPPDLSHAAVYAALGRMPRSGLWLEGISLKNKKILIRGFALNQSLVAQFIHSINEQTCFKNGQISRVDRLPSRGEDTMYSFEVYADAVV